MITELPTEPLTREQENELARAKTEEARNTLVLHSMREAMSYAHRCCRGGLDQNDLFSLSYDALQSAAKQFSPNRIRFFAYAKVYVRRGIAQAWRAKDVVRSSSLHEDDFEPASSPPDTRFIGGSQENDDMINPTYGDFSHFNPIEQSEIMGAVVDPEFEKIHIKERWQMIQPIIKSKLSESEQMILDLYYNGDLTLHRIGDLLNITRERVRQIQFSALKKIRSVLARKKTLYTE